MNRNKDIRTGMQLPRIELSEEVFQALMKRADYSVIKARRIIEAACEDIVQLAVRR